MSLGTPAIGILTSVYADGLLLLLRIDAWHVCRYPSSSIAYLAAAYLAAAYLTAAYLTAAYLTAAYLTAACLNTVSPTTASSLAAAALTTASSAAPSITLLLLFLSPLLSLLSLSIRLLL
jgi:hypothetical protein